MGMITRTTVGADKADGFGATAWAAAILFHDAVDKIVERDGVNGLTRSPKNVVTVQVPD